MTMPSDGPQPRVPDFFIVGQAKSGTTALYQMLRQHPDVFMPALKEPMFLAPDLPLRPGHEVPGLPTSMEDYLALFAEAAPGQIAGEASVLYLYSHSAADEIAALNPDAKVIVVFREPASFLRSLHLQLLQTRVESETDLATALALEEQRRRGSAIPADSRRPSLLMYSEHITYSAQLRRFYDALDPSQVLVLFYDDYSRDNLAVVNQVLEFLGVPPDSDLHAVRANPTVVVRSRLVEDVTHALAVGRRPWIRPVKRVITAIVPRSVRRRLVTFVQRRVVETAPPPVDDALMQQLRRTYRDEVVRLGELVGRDLVTQWGYDEA